MLGLEKFKILVNTIKFKQINFFQELEKKYYYLSLSSWNLYLFTKIKPKIVLVKLVISKNSYNYYTEVIFTTLFSKKHYQSYYDETKSFA